MKSLKEYVLESMNASKGDCFDYLRKNVSKYNETGVGQVCPVNDAKKLIDQIVSNFSSNEAESVENPSMDDYKKGDATYLAYNEDKCLYVFKYKTDRECFVVWEIYQNFFFKQEYRVLGEIYYREKEMEAILQKAEEEFGKMTYMKGTSEYFANIR